MLSRDEYCKQLAEEINLIEGTSFESNYISTQLEFFERGEFTTDPKINCHKLICGYINLSQCLEVLEYKIN